MTAAAHGGVLRQVVGFPYVELAAVMRCPEGTAKSHVAPGVCNAPVPSGLVQPMGRLQLVADRLSTA